MKFGNCSDHQYRPVVETIRSIGKLTVKACNNCLSVVVIQRRDDPEGPTTNTTEVEMKDSAYPYVK